MLTEELRCLVVGFFPRHQTEDDDDHEHDQENSVQADAEVRGVGFPRGPPAKTPERPARTRRHIVGTIITIIISKNGNYGWC